MEYEGNLYAWTSLEKPCPYAYEEFIDGACMRPEDPFDPWEDTPLFFLKNIA